MAIRIVIDILMLVGLVFCVAGVKGLIKMPDTFCRMQASTCISTLGVLCTAIGAVLYGVGKKKRWIHSVFHIFVVLGSVRQFMAIYFYDL